MSRLRLLILCGGAPRHLHFANALCGRADVLAIVQESGAEWNREKILRVLRPKTLSSKAWRWLRDRRRYTGDREARFFFGDAPATLDRADLVRSFPTVNHPGVADLVAALSPDLIAVFGTSLIKGALLEAGRPRLVNLHGGLSPQYRGADCTFWALHNGEPEQVGCTIHYIDPGIDTGGLIAHASPEVRPGDDELTLFWRAVAHSTDVFAELLDRVAAGERFGQQQPGRGRLYQVKDRLLRHERALARRMPHGIPADIRLPARTRWFPADETRDVREVDTACATSQ